MTRRNPIELGSLPSRALYPPAYDDAWGKAPEHEPEKFYTIQEAAQLLGIHVWALRRAVRRDQIPHYTLLNSRKLVLLSEVIASISASRVGGAS